MIAASLHKGARKIAEAYADKGWVFFTTWDDLIERAKQTHHQFREILKHKTTASVGAPDDLGPADARGAPASDAGHGEAAQRTILSPKQNRAPRGNNPKKRARGK